MHCLMVLDSNTFARTQFFRGGPWSLILFLYPPPSAKVLLELIIRDSIIRFVWARYIRPLEPPKCPLSGCQSIAARTIIVFCQRILECLHMTIRFPKQILHLLDSTLSLPITFMVVGAGHLVNDVIVAAPVGELLVFKAGASVGPHVGRFSISPDPISECR